ncbi:MAG: response regulator [Cyclobacteriaceae bacterium]|nr:response regulator [Cyclobacteriaceae bacterium]
MVADDNPDILDILKMILEVIGGYEVITTADGESVYDLLGEAPDLILLDVWMSGQNGSEICKNLKADKKTRDLPLILFSASKNIQDISRSEGADDFLAKPFQMDVLLKKVARLTNKD